MKELRLLVLISLSGLHHSDTVTIQGQAEEDSSLSDKIFTANLLFESAVRSLQDCVRLCRITSGCVTLSYMSSSTSCRGHTSAMTSGSPFQSSPGAKTFVLDWLNAACTDNSECPVENAECFKGKCLCTPGYYFSLSTRTCRADCSEDDLQNEFVLYPSARIFLNNLFGVLSPTDEACRTLCLGLISPVCRSFDYKFTSPTRCLPQNLTVLDVPDFWRGDSKTHSYFQRVCA